MSSCGRDYCSHGTVRNKVLESLRNLAKVPQITRGEAWTRNQVFPSLRPSHPLNHIEAFSQTKKSVHLLQKNQIKLNQKRIFNMLYVAMKCLGSRLLSSYQSISISTIWLVIDKLERMHSLSKEVENRLLN